MTRHHRHRVVPVPLDVREVRRPLWRCVNCNDTWYWPPDRTDPCGVAK